MPAQRVTFEADGVPLVGLLHLPAGAGPWPAVALTGPLSGVKEQVVGLYAARLAELGLAALAFDHRGFGESGGRRQHEDSSGKLADLRAAVGYLQAHPAVDPDRVGMLGVCLGGGYAIRAAAFDPRIRAVATVAGAYNDPVVFSASMGATAYRSAIGGFLAAGPDEVVPAVSPNGGRAAMPGQEPWDYYGSDRSASPHWVNQVTVHSLYELMTLDTTSAAALLEQTPLLVVHGKTDGYCSPTAAETVYDKAPGPKTMAWIDTTNHIDLYDREPYLGEAVSHLRQFFERELAHP